MFGYHSDIERADMLYTSLLVQMWQGLAGPPVPAWTQQSAGVAAQLGCSGSPPP